MDNSGYYRLSQILEIIPISKSAWHIGISRGIFPAPQKLGRLSLWKKREVHQVLENIEKGVITELCSTKRVNYGA